MPPLTDDSAAQAVRALARASRVLERASRVAARLALGRPTISAAVDALGQRGLLIRVGAPADGRAATLSLTHEGRQVLARVEAEMVERLETLCARTPDRERVLESLTWLASAMDEARDARSAGRPEVRP